MFWKKKKGNWLFFFQLGNIADTAVLPCTVVLLLKYTALADRPAADTIGKYFPRKLGCSGLLLSVASGTPVLTKFNFDHF